MEAFLALDGQARADLGVTPVATEMAFGRDAPFAIDLPDGRSLAISGKVDRVDASPARVAVIDYKTGRVPSPRQPDPFVDGIRLQLPIYALAARQVLHRPTAEIAAEYWYLDDQVKGQARHAVDVGDATLRRLAEVLATIVDAMAGGLFAPRPDQPDPWRRRRCWCCDPDGADTATLWGQWRRKLGDPALAPYLQLVEARGSDPDEQQQP